MPQDYQKHLKQVLEERVKHGYDEGVVFTPGDQYIIVKKTTFSRDMKYAHVWVQRGPVDDEGKLCGRVTSEVLTYDMGNAFDRFRKKVVDIQRHQGHPMSTQFHKDGFADSGYKYENTYLRELETGNGVHKLFKNKFKAMVRTVILHNKKTDLEFEEFEQPARNLQNISLSSVFHLAMTDRYFGKKHVFTPKCKKDKVIDDRGIIEDNGQNQYFIRFLNILRVDYKKVNVGSDAAQFIMNYLDSIDRSVLAKSSADDYKDLLKLAFIELKGAGLSDKEIEDMTKDLKAQLEVAAKEQGHDLKEDKIASSLLGRIIKALKSYFKRARMRKGSPKAEDGAEAVATPVTHRGNLQEGLERDLKTVETEERVSKKVEASDLAGQKIGSGIRKK